MSIPESARFDELLSRYLDASLEAAEEREFVGLLADEALAARFHEATQLDAEVAGILAGSAPDEVMISLVWSDVIQAGQAPAHEAVRPWEAGISGLGAWSRRWRLPAWMSAAAVVVACAVAAAYYSRPRVTAPPAVVLASAPEGARASAPEGARAEAVHGEVYLVRPSGRERLAGGLALGAGGATVETVGPRSRATLTLGDGSKIELKGDSRFVVELGAAERRLFLEKGMLVATVAKQPEKGPLSFETDRATATVRGTQFALVAETMGAYLIVTEGTAALRRRSGGPEVLIEAGFYGHVELQGQFYPFPISRLPRALQEELPER